MNRLLGKWVYKYLLVSLLSILLGIYPEMELLDHMLILYLIFLENAILFSIAAAPFYIPTISAQRFQFVHISRNTCYFLGIFSGVFFCCCCFIISVLVGVIMKWHCNLIMGFSCIFLMTGGFPGSSDCKEPACNAGDPDLIPGSGRSLGEGNGNPLQYSCLENPMDRIAWQATVHGVTKNWTQLSN